MMENMGGNDKVCGGHCNCRCMHHKVVPLMVFIIGLAFILGKMNILTMGAVDWIWPIATLIAGGTMMGQGRCKCC